MTTGQSPAATVPTGAVLYRNNKPGVFVLQPAGTVHFQPVTVQSRTDARTSVEGVAVGAQVIVDGAGFLNEGDRVSVAQAPGAALRKRGTPGFMSTGANARTAAAGARQVGITDYRAEVLPADKDALVRDLPAPGEVAWRPLVPAAVTLRVPPEGWLAVPYQRGPAS